MAGSLIKIDEEIVTSAVASVDLGGANWDSSYDVYKVVISNLKIDTDTVGAVFRYLDTSNNPITVSSYDVAFKVLKANTTAFEDAFGSGTLSYVTDLYIGNDTGESANLVMYLFNSNNASEYSFHTLEGAYLSQLANLKGQQGGGVLKQTSATKGVRIFLGASGNIDEGKFTLYGLNK